MNGNLTLPAWTPSSASTNVKAFRYMPWEQYGTANGWDSDVLEVMYDRGDGEERVYRYFGVSEAIFDDFFAAVSKGRYSNAILATYYSYRVS